MALSDLFTLLPVGSISDTAYKFHRAPRVSEHGTRIYLGENPRFKGQTLHVLV